MSVETFTTFYDSKTITATTGGAAATLVYTVPAHHDAEVTMIMVANGAATITTNVQIYRKFSDSYTFLIKTHSILTGLTYNALGPSRIFLHAGDKILAFKSGGTLDVSVSGKHIYNPSRNI